jgi:hypothetical protein
MTGTIPVYKLHGSLSWSLTGQTVVTYQDMRSAFRHGGNAAIIPPIPEKLVPAWLKAVWYEAALALCRSHGWVICVYSAPAYDTEVLRLLSDGGIGRPLTVLLLSPDSDFLLKRWNDIVPEENIIPSRRDPSARGSPRRTISINYRQHATVAAAKAGLAPPNRR